MKAAPSVYLHDFRLPRVGASLAQADVAAWLKEALHRTRGGRPGPQDRRAAALYDRLGRGGAVAERVSVLADYGRRDWRRMDLFRPRPGARWSEPPLQDRMAVYEARVLSLA